jgi:hypothetical protein
MSPENWAEQWTTQYTIFVQGVGIVAQTVDKRHPDVDICWETASVPLGGESLYELLGEDMTCLVEHVSFVAFTNPYRIAIKYIDRHRPIHVRISRHEYAFFLKKCNSRKRNNISWKQCGF